jgi:hypothetical protein
MIKPGCSNASFKGGDLTLFARQILAAATEPEFTEKNNTTTKMKRKENRRK